MTPTRVETRVAIVTAMTEMPAKAAMNTGRTRMFRMPTGRHRRGDSAARRRGPRPGGQQIDAASR